MGFQEIVRLSAIRLAQRMESFSIVSFIITVVVTFQAVFIQTAARRRFHLAKATLPMLLSFQIQPVAIFICKPILLASMRATTLMSQAQPTWTATLASRAARW